MGQSSLSVVIPAFNEAGRLAATLHALWAATADLDVETIVVDDGSTDDTAGVATKELASRAGTMIRFEDNRGKGAAVRAGVGATTRDTVLYMDADLATDLDVLPAFLDALQQADIVSASRTLPHARVKGSTVDRATMAWVFNKIVHAFTRVDSRDTQCGFKVFRGDRAREIFALARCDRFAFDVEVLLLARRFGLRVVELPVTWTAVEGSSVRRGTDSFQAAFDVVRIARRWTPARFRRALEAQRTRPVAAEG